MPPSHLATSGWEGEIKTETPARVPSILPVILLVQGKEYSSRDFRTSGKSRAAGPLGLLQLDMSCPGNELARLREGQVPGCQRYPPLTWALREGLGGTRSRLAKPLLLRKNKEEGKQPGGDAVCPAVFTAPSPTLKWPIVEIACSLIGLGRAAGQRGFTGPLPANPAAKNWASYLTLQRQHPFPSQGVITNIHVGGKKKKQASKHRQGHTRLQMQQQRDPLKGSGEVLRSSELRRLPCRYTHAVCICLLTFQLRCRE